MDFQNYEQLRRAWPWAGNRIFLLGAFDAGGAPGSALEIADPWGGPAIGFRRCYLRIAASLDAFMQGVVLPQVAARGLAPVPPAVTVVTE